LSEYLSKLAAAVADPMWMANTGIPLVATVVGLATAYLFLRRQLQSD
jgi:hypothetical protein